MLIVACRLTHHSPSIATHRHSPSIAIHRHSLLHAPQTPDCDLFVFSFVLHENTEYLLDRPEPPPTREPAQDRDVELVDRPEPPQIRDTSQARHAETVDKAEALEQLAACGGGDEMTLGGDPDGGGEMALAGGSDGIGEMPLGDGSGDASTNTNVHTDPNPPTAGEHGGGLVGGCLKGLFANAKVGAAMVMMDPTHRLWPNMIHTAMRYGWRAEVVVVKMGPPVSVSEGCAS